ncbi:hypothetical protein KL86DPRO_10381 [uncultured delta proteobacterium]|uniref:Uncharacterized protein n=1 Tax=uncultured delta proteobacterium TaxID=34034 RepID=A0A212IZC7_9DELT|nr:hypothetical protein KL86DPRO_10381 [uncultured delta proteobacterium]
MNREKAARTMEDVVRSYRRQLDADAGEPFTNMGNMMKIGLESIWSMVSGTESDKHAISMFKSYADNFEEALQDDDRFLAERALEDLERSIQAFRVKSDSVN